MADTTGSPFHRRDGYWPSNPVVGARGAETRRRITIEALALFGRDGFHETSIEAIASATGVSRATLYQYFGSKDGIFVELVEECGTALRRVVRRLGPLGPTAEGFDNLRWWLGKWAGVYDQYAAIFAQWSSVDGAGQEVRPRVLGFLQAYNTRVATRLATSGVVGMGPSDTAVVLTSVVHRFNFFRHHRIVPMPPGEEALDGLAVVLQLMLFPNTPAEAFADLPPAPVRPVREAPPRPVPDTRALSPRARDTVARLHTAGIELFAEVGYHNAGVDDLVARAGVARATFYKYFSDKLDLLRRLSGDCAEVADEVVGTLAGLRVDDLDEGLHAWVADFVAFHRRYLGVFRAWVEGRHTDEVVVVSATHATGTMHSYARHLIDQVPRTHPFDADVAAVVLFVMLDRVPEALREWAECSGLDPAEDHAITVLDQAVARAVLGRPHHPAVRKADEPAVQERTHR